VGLVSAGCGDVCTKVTTNCHVLGGTNKFFMQWCESLTVTAFKTAFISRHGCSGTLISHLGAVNILWKNLCYKH